MSDRRIDINRISQMLPHRYPFVLVDRIVDYEVGQWLKAIKNVTINEQFFPGHFPNQAVMPGVLILEALAQAAGLLAILTCDLANEENNVFYLAGIDNARFKRVVIPGDQLLLSVNVEKARTSLWRVHCEATVDGILACSADIMNVKGAERDTSNSDR